MNPDVKTFFDEATFTATHVVWDPETKRAAIIDSVHDYDPKSGRTDTASADAVIAFVQENGLEVDWILETHVHADHLTAAPYLQEKLGGRPYASLRHLCGGRRRLRRRHALHAGLWHRPLRLPGR